MAKEESTAKGESMAKGESTPLKSVVVVFGALAFAWAAIELAFKPLFGKNGGSKDKSDDVDIVVAAKELPEELETAAVDAAEADAAAASSSDTTATA